jgi:hypothetical protein
MRQRFGIFAVAACILGLSSCAAIQENQARLDQQKQQKCQQFGLTPGSSAYVQCISQGPDAYAAAQKSTNAAPVVLFAPASSGRNNSCSAPKSAGQGSCGGCSVSCGDKQASCTAGEEMPGGSAMCLKNAVCECR